MKKLKLNFWIFSVLLTNLVFTACEPNGEDAPVDFRITSQEFEDGIMIVPISEDVTTSFTIETNLPAEFSKQFPADEYEISPSGEFSFSGPNTHINVFFVEVKREGSDIDKKILPVILTNRPQEYRKVVNSLVNFQNQNKELALVFRHMEADVGLDSEDSGLDEWWTSCDPDVARQLSQSGKNMSLLIGNTIKKLNVPVGQGISSQMCRASQSLESMELGLSILRLKELNPLAEFDPENAFSRASDFLPDYMSQEEMLLVGAHSNLILGNPFYEQFAFFRMGDGFLLEKGPQGQLELVGGVPNEIWRAMLYSDFY